MASNTARLGVVGVVVTDDEAIDWEGVLARGDLLGEDG